MKASTKDSHTLEEQQVVDMTKQLEQMRATLDRSREEVNQLKAARPKLRFIGPWTKQPWEVLSLRKRLKTVEEVV